MSKQTPKARAPGLMWDNRVQELLRLEQRFNDDWSHQNIYETDAPFDGNTQEHYTVTFPFPYMNGRLHLGHLFTITKAEFSARYQRMKGKHVLFPFAFHCTGMPIKASADKLAFELETGQQIKSTNVNLKSKAASKTEDNLSQFEIMQRMGIPDHEILEFCDTQKWVRYFPPIAQHDLEQFGACIDWRRTFTTTDVNPYYDHFIRWQFNILYSQNYLEFGKRATIYSLKDQQPCLDHDRSVGEGVMPQEYTLVKLELQDPNSVHNQFKTIGKPVFLLATTLRPETMIGQTNFWVKPNAKYQVVLSKDGNEIYVAGRRSVQNLFAQGLIQSNSPLFILEGNSLFGTICTCTLAHQLVNASESPFASDGTPFDIGGKPKEGEELHLRLRPLHGFFLPGILMNKGTGIVTSVPSDAPADFAEINEIKKDSELLTKFGIGPHHLYSIPITDAPNAEYFLKVVGYKEGQKNDAKLEEAKQQCYKVGFHKGTMIRGMHKGEKISIAQEKIKAEMVEANQAISYFEPESKVISRSGDECVVVFCDQWSIKYGKRDWKQRVVDHFNQKVHCYHAETREKFNGCFDWLSNWACSRQFGLGSRLPFAEDYLVDSLSDSTIYTAYYTIAHLLQGDVYGEKAGMCGLTPDQANDEFFNCIFLNGPAPSNVPPEIIAKFKQEFNYWYPITCRVSGKDLVPNHLTMYLYNHAAIFPEDKWPIGIRVNGHLKLNNKKMAKSTGNFLTVVDSIQKFSASAVRIALADSGDLVDDANFDENVAQAVVNDLYQFLDMCKYHPAESRPEIDGYYDELFDARISKSIKDSDVAFSQMRFKGALTAGFHEMQNSWTDYLASCKLNKIPVCAPLRQRYIDSFVLMLSPIAPHFADYVWRDILGHKKSVVLEKYPEPKPYDPKIFFVERFIFKSFDQIRYKINKTRADMAALFIQTRFSEMELAVLSILQQSYDKELNIFDTNEISTALKTNPVLERLLPKEYMPFVNLMEELALSFGDFVLSPEPVLDQKSILQKNEARLLRQLPGIKSIEVIDKVGNSDLFVQEIFDEARVYFASANIHKISQ